MYVRDTLTHPAKGLRPLYLRPDYLDSVYVDRFFGVR